MAAKPLSEKQLRDAAIALTTTNGNVVEAARLVGIKKSTFENHARQANERGLVDLEALREAAKAEQRQIVVQPSPRLPITADEAWELLDGWIGRKRIPKERPPKFHARRERKYVIAGDFHSPFQDNEAVAELIANESGKTDTLIISGDLMDFYGISRFMKYEHIPIEQEIAGADALLTQLASAFSDVLIVEGNHDKPRFEKQLRSFLSPEMMHCIELLTGGNLSIVHLLAKRHGNVRFAPQQAGHYTLGWLTQVGDLIVSHAEKFSSVPGSALRKIEEGMADFERVYGLQPWRVLVQAHTHAFSMIPWHSDKLLCEGGAMCLTHGYQLTARMGGRPQRIGYTTLQQTDGKTDLNSVKFHWLNAEKRAA